MRALVFVLGILLHLFPSKDVTPAVIPPMPNYAPVVIPSCKKECACWDCYWIEAANEYADEFTALFNSYEVKRAKNGAMMIRRPGEKSFKFCKRGN